MLAVFLQGRARTFAPVALQPHPQGGCAIAARMGCAWGTLAAMSDQTADEAASASWETLEDRIDRIIERNRTLASENKALRQAQRKWSVERADLVRRNELAKSRIEAMINRLKLLTDE